MSAAQPAAAAPDGGTADELDLTNAHLPSLAEVPGLTQQLTVRVGAAGSGVLLLSAEQCKPSSGACLLLAALLLLPHAQGWGHSASAAGQPMMQPHASTAAATASVRPYTTQSLDLTANRLRSLEPCLLALTGLRRLCLRQNLVSEPAEVEALGSASGGCCTWAASCCCTCAGCVRAVHGEPPAPGCSPSLLPATRLIFDSAGILQHSAQPKQPCCSVLQRHHQTAATSHCALC